MEFNIVACHVIQSVKPFLYYHHNRKNVNNILLLQARKIEDFVNSIKK